MNNKKRTKTDGLKYFKKLLKTPLHLLRLNLKGLVALHIRFLLFLEAEGFTYHHIGL